MPTEVSSSFWPGFLAASRAPANNEHVVDKKCAAKVMNFVASAPAC